MVTPLSMRFAGFKK